MTRTKSDKTITKTIWQYSEVLTAETMEFLHGIAQDYSKVKNYTYKRYSGIGSLNKLTPVYSILNEMRYCGLRDQLKLPVVYYELAISDAITDIKGNWGILKNKLNDLITSNENLQENDRKYLRTVLKLNNVYASILNNQEYDMPNNVKSLELNVKRLNNLLCRLTRRYLTVPQTNSQNIFRITPNGYSYKNGIFHIVCRVPRKRMAIPLKDKRTFDRQILVYVKQNYIALAIPVEIPIQKHNDYINILYIHIGNKDMFTLSNGNVYGASLEERTAHETERLNEKNRRRGRMHSIHKQNVKLGHAKKAENIEVHNLGKIKYDRQKEKERSGITTYINSEINRMIVTEKPKKIFITRPITKNKTKYYSKFVNRKLASNFRGYIRERLNYKCLINAIEINEINSKGTGSICSSCGAQGIRQSDRFLCEVCGLQTTVSMNSARNIQNKCKKNG